MGRQLHSQSVAPFVPRKRLPDRAFPGAVLPPRGRWMCCAGFPCAFGLPSTAAAQGNQPMISDSISSESIHVVTNGKILFFLLMTEQYSIVCVYCIFIHTHPWMDTGGFRISTVLNKAAITRERRYLSDVLFRFLWINIQKWICWVTRWFCF